LMGATHSTKAPPPPAAPQETRAVAQEEHYDEEDEGVDWPVVPPPPAGIETLGMSHRRVKALPSLEACYTTLRELYLRRCGLRGGPALAQELARCSGLRALDLAYNLLRVADDVVPLLATALPATLESLSLRRSVVSAYTPFRLGDDLVSLGRLASLTRLDLGECMLCALPSSLGDLVALTELRLDYNMLESLPESIGQLTRLEFLDVSCNSLTSLPATLGKCTALKFLSAGRNKLLSLPEELAGLQQLQTLKLFPSNMPALPRVVGTLKSLRHLEFGGTATLAIDGELITALTCLESLSLRWNKLTELPADAFSRLTALQTLDINGNEQLTSLPKLPPSCHNLCTAFTQIPADAVPATVTTLLTERGFVRWQSLAAAENALPRWQSLPPAIRGTRLSPEEFLDRFLGTIFGGAIGDAIGLATEFMSKKQAFAEYGIGPLEHGTFLRDRHRSRWDIGDYTDDTDQSILLMRNVVKHNGAVVARDFGSSLLEWAKQGFPELGDTGGFGIGSTVSAVLRHADFLADPHKAARETWEKMGKTAAPNGAVMRTAVLGLVSFYDEATVAKNTLEMCTVTHYDPRCRSSCVAVTAAIAAMLRGEQDAARLTELAIAAGLGSVSADESQSFEQDFRSHMTCTSFADAKLDESSRIGFTFKALAAGFVALRLDDFEHAITEVTMQAGDADTNAAVAGALLGCKLGYRRLPRRWLEGILHREWLLREAEAFWRVIVAS